MSVDPLRAAAHGVLTAVTEGELLEPALDAALDRALPRDRALLAELVRGTLQWQGRYDHLIRRFSRRKAPTDPRLVTLLRLALHQLLALDGVPAYAAVHQAGELCRRSLGSGRVGFVNGLLQAIRRATAGPAGSSEDAEARATRLRPHFADLETGSTAWIAAWHSHPEWLVARWRQEYGAEQADAICAWNNKPVPVVFHVLAPHDPEPVRERLCRSGCEVTPGTVPRALVLGRSVPRARLREILDATPEIIVQDVAVQEATGWLAADQAPPPGHLVDLCAAPGGKTAHLASTWGGNGRILAMDNRPARVRLLVDTVKRIETGRVDVVLADGTQPPLSPGSCAGVLVDGPCSGTGVLRHHPDGRWRLRPDLPARRNVLLLDLVRAAADLLVPDGVLMYATCSLEPEENDGVVDPLLAGDSRLEPAPDADGTWRRQWLPGASGGDGFYAARLRRR